MANIIPFPPETVMVMTPSAALWQETGVVSDAYEQWLYIWDGQRIATLGRIDHNDVVCASQQPREVAKVGEITGDGVEVEVSAPWSLAAARLLHRWPAHVGVM